MHAAPLGSVYKLGRWQGRTASDREQGPALPVWGPLFAREAGAHPVPRPQSGPQSGPQCGNCLPSPPRPPQKLSIRVWFHCEVFGRLGPEHSDRGEHGPPSGTCGHSPYQALPLLPALGLSFPAASLLPTWPQSPMPAGSTRQPVLGPPCPAARARWLPDVWDTSVGTTPGRQLEGG